MQEKVKENESLLILNLSKGNLLAFNTLYYEYSDRLYRFALGYLKSEEEAEELVQEVFTIIWEKRTDLKEELSFKSFLFTIAFNIIRKHFRSRAYLQNYLQAGIDSNTDMQSYQEITYESLNRYITELVDKLPDRCREIFVSSRFKGFSIKEIAEQLNLSHKTVENQITHALKFLRTNLNKESVPLILFFNLFIS